MLALPSKQLVGYNWVDCLGTGRSHTAELAELVERGMDTYWRECAWPLASGPVMDMQRRGVRVDEGALRTYRRQLAKEIDAIEASVLAMDPTGELAKPTPMYPNSIGAHERLGKFLFNTLGLAPSKVTEKKQLPSTTQEALLLVLGRLRKKDEHARPVVEDLLHRSRLHTIKSRYLDMELEDGRVYPRVKVGGTKTGRFAYADPALQQMPPEARHVFIPEPGCVFVGADFSQLEARIAAYLANDAGDVAIFNSGADVHADTARTLYGWASEAWLALDEATRTGARNYAKTFRYGLLYGGAPETMKMKTYCPCPRCEAKLPPNVPRLSINQSSQRWLAAHPRVLLWREEISKQVASDGCLINALGRKRYFLEPWPRCKRQAWNWPIQSLAADIINRAMLKLYREHRPPFFLQMHDYLGLEVPEAEAGYWGEVLVDAMTAHIPEVGASFPVDLKIEGPWGVKWT
jgi:DNA polymerase-1